MVEMALLGERESGIARVPTHLTVSLGRTSLLTRWRPYSMQIEIESWAVSEARPRRAYVGSDRAGVCRVSGTGELKPHRTARRAN